MLKVLSYILCDLDQKVKVIGQKAGICDGVPSLSALVLFVHIEIQSEIGHCSCDSAKFKAPADFSHHAILFFDIVLNGRFPTHVTE